jgi:outer membrane protein assembly factor BamB
MLEKKIKQKKVISALLAFFLILIIAGTNTGAVYADVPYKTYSYNFWSDDVLQPHSYLYSGKLTSKEFGTTLAYPKDMFLYNNEIYVADTDNSRILKMSTDGKILMELTYAKGEDDPLNKPQGVYVTKEGHIYVADSDNGRIVEYNSDGSYLREIGRPVGKTGPSDCRHLQELSAGGRLCCHRSH